MTPGELRVILANLLAPYLGEFALPGGATVPAIFVGEPPADWTATGLECNIQAVPATDQRPAWLRGLTTRTHRVRLISHGSPTEMGAAVEAVLARWSDARATEIPGNEALGILSQYSIDIP